jgi:hypothetical protein
MSQCEILTEYEKKYHTLHQAKQHSIVGLSAKSEKITELVFLSTVLNFDGVPHLGRIVEMIFWELRR